MKIRRDVGGGIALWLSANDTYNWAHKTGNSWPCSQLSGKRLFAQFASNGDLEDFAINGRTEDIDANELNAITEDFLAPLTKATGGDK